MQGEADNESIWCYQVSGYSEFGDSVGWKLFRYTEISNLKVTGEYFTDARPGYDPNKLGMTTICCSVSLNRGDESEQKNTTVLVQSSKREGSSYDRHETCAVSSQKHNEHMRRFRLSHSVSLLGPSGNQKQTIKLS